MPHISTPAPENTPGIQTHSLIDLKYLEEMMNGNKALIKEILELFLQQVPEELISINSAIEKENFAVIKSLSHSMRSSFSVLDISTLTPILSEMEDLSSKGIDLVRIQSLNSSLQHITRLVIEEATTVLQKYV